MISPFLLLTGGLLKAVFFAQKWLPRHDQKQSLARWAQLQFGPRADQAAKLEVAAHEAHLARTPWAPFRLVVTALLAVNGLFAGLYLWVSQVRLPRALERAEVLNVARERAFNAASECAAANEGWAQQYDELAEELKNRAEKQFACEIQARESASAYAGREAERALQRRRDSESKRTATRAPTPAARQTVVPAGPNFDGDQWLRELPGTSDRDPPAPAGDNSVTPPAPNADAPAGVLPNPATVSGNPPERTENPN